MKYRYLGLSCASLILLGATLSFAQQTEQTPPEKPGEKAAEKPKEEKKTPRPEDKSGEDEAFGANRRAGSEVHGDGGHDGNEAGRRNAKSQHFLRGVHKDEVADASKRPITFAFNGGPGAASVVAACRGVGSAARGDGRRREFTAAALQIRGQRIVDFGCDGYCFYRSGDDGLQPAGSGEADKQFHGVQEDVQSVGDFIRLWATRNRRWSSPKFLAGKATELRARLGLSGYMQQRYGMYLNGIILISSILNFRDGGVRYGQRFAVHVVFADIHGDCLVSQEIAE